MARIDNLNNFLSDVANSIRTKTNSTEKIEAVNFDSAINSIQVHTPQLLTKIFLRTEDWTVPDGVTQVFVRIFGAGGSGAAAGGGGGGGNMATGTFNVTPGEVIPVTVAPQSNLGAAGGTSSFGTYISATGGARGTQTNGGDGGSGGGGGGGGRGYAGGRGGQYGGNGGNGGNPSTYTQAENGTNTIGMGLEVEGAGLAGGYYTANGSLSDTSVIAGAGGGGYGGNGGRGVKNSYVGGAGGGGYGGNGGNGSSGAGATSARGGSGGGGYGGDGGTGNENYSGGGGGGYFSDGGSAVWGSGGQGGGVAAGGAGSPNSNSGSVGSGGQGICIIQYMK